MFFDDFSNGATCFVWNLLKIFMWTLFTNGQRILCLQLALKKDVFSVVWTKYVGNVLNPKKCMNRVRGKIEYLKIFVWWINLLHRTFLCGNFKFNTWTTNWNIFAFVAEQKESEIVMEVSKKQLPSRNNWK